MLVCQPAVYTLGKMCSETEKQQVTEENVQMLETMKKMKKEKYV